MSVQSCTLLAVVLEPPVGSLVVEKAFQNPLLAIRVVSNLATSMSLWRTRLRSESDLAASHSESSERAQNQWGLETSGSTVRKSSTTEL